MNLTEASTKQVQIEGKTYTQQEQYWHGHYCRWQQSGLTMAGYARSQGLVVNSFYGWHSILKQRGLAKQEPAPAVFHRVAIKPTEQAADRNEGDTTLRFRLPNGIDCELAAIKPDNFLGLLESLAHLRL